MVNQINDIAWQAHQGSLAAIIQILNEKLANSGVRTRAIFDNGILQLLCEARSLDRLEQSTLVNQVQQILESIAPRNIRRVNINSRIVREQQLLWLEEIKRDPEHQLLWSQEILLVQPNKIKQLIEHFSEIKTEYQRPKLLKFQYSKFSSITNNKGYSKLLPRKIKTTASLLLITLIGWLVYSLLGSEEKQVAFKDAKFSQSIQYWKANINHKNQTISQEVITNNSNNPTVAPQVTDPFVLAVRIANQATLAAKIAKTSAEWSEIAAQWQKASKLMSAVPANHSRYELAQNRTELYKKYSQVAQREANKK